MEHISLDKIHSYLEGQIKGAEAVEVEGHFVICDRCHALFAGLKEMEMNLERCFKVEIREGCPEDWEIATFIRQELDLSQSETITQHVNSCDYCIDRATIYYKSSLAEEVTVRTPREWVEKAVNLLKGDEVPLKEEIPLFKRAYLFVRNVISTLPPLPGYAIATITLILLIWSTFPEPPRIVTIASSQRITFKEVGAPSSFAFMDGEEVVKRFEGMKVKKDGEKLVFSWRPIEGAKVSEFVLRKKGLDKDTHIATLSVASEVIVVPINRVQFNERYEWIISGFMEDGRKFEAAAEFILVR